MRLLIFAVASLCLACESTTPAETGADAGVDAASPGLAAVEGRIEPLFLGVWAAGADEAFFAGGGQGETGGVLARFDGARLTRESIPVGDTLWWVWGSDARHVWACGEGGRIIGWADRAWREEPTGLPAEAVLWGLWGASATDVWAVGGSALPEGPKGVVLRSTGRGDWVRLDDPALPDAPNLYKVWGTGPDDVHFVGEGGVALRWDGTRLERVETGTTDLLFTVHGRAGGPILAVGGAQSAVVRRFDGDAWIEEAVPEGWPPLNGVFVRSDGSAIVTGGRGMVAERSVDGIWQRIPSPRGVGWAGDTLHAVFVAQHTWVVGGDFAELDHGTILTDRRPLPPIDLRPVAPPAPPLDQGVAPDMALDAGVPDAAPDAMPVDMAIDAAVDAGPDLAFARCGDGLLSVLEDCDDGNTDPDDGCDARCRFECGNGQIDGAEACDDGNRVAGDGCDPNCGSECGNGVLDADEACDDGNNASEDGCDPLCRLECGNGAVEGVEACDDGNRERADGCDAACQLECGNGVIEGAEECDDGGRAPADGCGPDCRIECGNGQLDAAEACDDGNRESADGCDAACQLECGNGQIEGVETCDDGGRAPGDGCDAECRLECGNARLDEGEGCDDGNRVSADGCDAACQLECGNGQIEGVETCDDGGRAPGDGCDAECRLECGNGRLDPGEACDDGNLEPDDGCDEKCRVVRLPGPGEDCPDARCAPGLSCFAIAEAGFRRVCIHPCATVDDCADYAEPTCCQPPGPQIIDTWCIPRRHLADGCANGG